MIFKSFYFQCGVFGKKTELGLIIWNSRYLDKVYWTVKDKDWFNEKEFKRVSPLGTQHVNFLGKYIFEEKIITAEDGLRDLEIKDLD